MIVGTAGHIDHGKTTLVRALTGVDTDRLKEEKERGISIELGFAYAPLDDGGVLGFVDVPGHERFVHTMVAGATGIDYALLVVAADDGIMPQTREHLAIIELLDVRRGAVAITKIDRVDEARLDGLKTEIAAQLDATPLAGFSMFGVDARDDAHEGVRALRAHLHREAAQRAQRSSAGLFRLAVDRVFTLPGHGTIATGTVFSGRVSVGDRVTIMPAGIETRVRSLHAQNRPAESGTAGQRCAINLAGVDRSALTRGDWLTEPEALRPTERIDVRWRLTADQSAEIADGTPLHAHLGTAHRVGRVFALPGVRRAQFVFDRPLCATTGDRFIVRDAKGARTIGGGIVLDPYAPARKRRSPERVACLDAIERLLEGEGPGDLVECAPHGVHVADLVRATHDREAVRHLPATTCVITTADGDFVISLARRRALMEETVAALRRFHDAQPNEPGVPESRLHRMAAPTAPASLMHALCNAWAAERVIARNGAWLHLPDHRVKLDDREAQLATELLPRIVAGHFDPPWVRDLAVETAAAEDVVRTTLRKLVVEGSVYQVVQDLFYTRESIGELAQVAASLAAAHGAIEAAHYRDATKLGRKRAIQILEFFDRVGYTRRVRDAHRLRDPAQQIRF